MIEEYFDSEYFLDFSLIFIEPCLLYLIIFTAISRTKYLRAIDYAFLSTKDNFQIRQRANFSIYIDYKNNFPDKLPEIQNEIEETFKRWKKRFPDDYLAYAYEVTYTYYFVKDIELTKIKMYLLGKFEQFSPSFLYFLYDNLVSKVNSISNSEYFYIFSLEKEKLNKLDRSISSLVLKFFDRSISAYQRETTGINLYKSIKKMGKKFKIIVKKYGENYEILKLYGNFLSDLLNNEDKARTYKQMSIAFMDKTLSKLIYSDLNLFSDRIGHIIISDSPEGEILQINKAAADILESSISDLLKSNISAYFPEPLNSQAFMRKLIKKYIQSNKVCKILEPEICYIITSKGYLKEVYIKFEGIVWEKKLLFVIAILAVNRDKEYALFYSNNVIASHSANFGNIFNYTTDLKNEKLNKFIPNFDFFSRIDANGGYEVLDSTRKKKIFLLFKTLKFEDLDCFILFATTSEAEKKKWTESGFAFNDFQLKNSLLRYLTLTSIEAVSGLKSILKKKNAKKKDLRVNIDDIPTIWKLEVTDFSPGIQKSTEHKDVPNPETAHSKIRDLNEKKRKSTVHSDTTSQSSYRVHHFNYQNLLKNIKNSIKNTATGLYTTVSSTQTILFCFIIISMIIYSTYINNTHEEYYTFEEISNFKTYTSEIAIAVRSIDLNTKGYYTTYNVSQYNQTIQDNLLMFQEDFLALVSKLGTVCGSVKNYYQTAEFFVYKYSDQQISMNKILLVNLIQEYIANTRNYINSMDYSSFYYIIHNSFIENMQAYYKSADRINILQTEDLNKLYIVEIYIIIGFVAGSGISFSLFVLKSLFVIDFTGQNVWKRYNSMSQTRINRIVSKFKEKIGDGEILAKEKEKNSYTKVNYKARRKSVKILLIFLLFFSLSSVYFITYYFVVYVNLSPVEVNDSYMQDLAKSRIESINEVYFWIREISLLNTSDSIYNIIPEYQTGIPTQLLDHALNRTESLNYRLTFLLADYLSGASNTNSFLFQNQNNNTCCVLATGIYSAVKSYLYDAQHYRQTTLEDNFEIQKNNINYACNQNFLYFNEVFSYEIRYSSQIMQDLTIAYIIANFLLVFFFCRPYLHKMMDDLVSILKLNYRIIPER